MGMGLWQCSGHTAAPLLLLVPQRCCLHGQSHGFGLQLLISEHIFLFSLFALLQWFWCWWVKALSLHTERQQR